jgi:hypothetical protein
MAKQSLQESMRQTNIERISDSCRKSVQLKLDGFTKSLTRINYNIHGGLSDIDVVTSENFQQLAYFAFNVWSISEDEELIRFPATCCQCRGADGTPVGRKQSFMMMRVSLRSISGIMPKSAPISA